MKQEVKVLFASGSDDVIARVIERMKTILPELPLVVVAEFPPGGCVWIPFHIKRTWRENRALIRAKLGGRKIRISAVILQPKMPYWGMRLLGLTLAPLYFLAFNEEGEHFMLRPRSLPNIARHLMWRVRNYVRLQVHPGGWIYTQLWRAVHPREFRRPLFYRLAMLRAMTARHRPARLDPVPPVLRPRGVSVVIPSRNGRELLDRCLPRIYDADEIIVVDNGSEDGTAEFLGRDFPSVTVELSAPPLSFARAINRGIRRARYSHVCVLNNDMVADPNFLSSLARAFERIPDLFASTAQIFFPEGQRREETGKTVMPAERPRTGFPVQCDEPLPGEDLTWVLYGSGGCTLFDAAKLAALGGFDEVYEPAYVEDLDLGVRAWKRGWPTVYCRDARVLHLHRATTSRYFTEEQLDQALEFNYIRFLARAAGDTRLWRENVTRLNLAKKVDALAFAARQRITVPEGGPTDFFDLTNGSVAVFPGKMPSEKPVILVASPYLPFPLAHGAAVRIYNLMRRAARDFDLVLVSFIEESRPIPQELLDICVEIVAVRRPGTHALPSTPRPDTVEEFDSPSFHAALRRTIARWKPGVAQLEFTQMAQYASDCAPARTLLVEHDITYDLFAQMLARDQDWETRRQYQRWLSFETEAWKRVDRVVVMSEKDRQLVPGAVTIPNGVDLGRFQPAKAAPEPWRLLFIGSFAHRPNVLALEFFLSEVWPKIPDATLHVIAGLHHERFWDLRAPGIAVEGFVADVRPAYHRAAIVIAPLVSSAGTNIKIMEAMAMGKAIVSTPAGVHGLEIEPGKDAIVAESAEELAAAIQRLLDHPQDRLALEKSARQTAERLYGWDAIAERQKALYDSLSSR